MKLKQTTLFTAMLLLASMSLQAQKVNYVSTTASDRWQESKTTLMKNFSEGQSVDIEIYADKPLQTMDGFGGTFNELGWDALQELPQAKQDEIMAAFFSKEGANFSYARTPVAASDYALSYYSYCDVSEDFTMRDFNIDRDKYILIPYIKAALKYRPDLVIWSSPWTPPAWMKINEHYTLRAGNMGDREGGNEMDPGKNVMGNCTAFNMQIRYLQAYALYFSKYVQAYAEQGVNISAIMPQNEIAWSPNWPCCTWRPDDMALFISDYLGPRFKEDNLDTEIWLGTINFNKPDYVRTILDNKKAADYITGVGFQWTGVQSLPYIAKEYPSYKYMQTENICGDGENDWAAFERSWDAVCTYLSHNTSSYLYWNMILDETGKSAWGWPQNSMVVINRETKEVTYNDEYYLMKHLSHYMTPETKLLSTNAKEDCLAFDLGDGKILVHLVNKEESSKATSFSVNGKGVEVTLQPKSINTFVL